ncbi:unnamed protein product [Eruca vesicaria subsp. sativa]|uniref:Uncharacterized protein n=1 Tax=Eruca vesicaria subsp. sativa TaxID=29727 RepID=A0ABC8IW29_ERUVS|nr:unnamed protein product [Eruca vesicaria subsp. sativa]
MKDGDVVAHLKILGKLGFLENSLLVTCPILTTNPYQLETTRRAYRERLLTREIRNLSNTDSTHTTNSPRCWNETLGSAKALRRYTQHHSHRKSTELKGNELD